MRTLYFPRPPYRLLTHSELTTAVLLQDAWTVALVWPLNSALQPDANPSRSELLHGLPDTLSDKYLHLPRREIYCTSVCRFSRC